MIVVDSNVLIDVIETDPIWREWSITQLDEAAGSGRVVINHIVLAEAAPRTGSLDGFLERLDEMAIEVVPLCDHSAYRAGEVFQRYRRKRGENAPASILADFLIGAHAESLDAAVLTRDPRFYRSYFPSLRVIAPEERGAT